MRPFNYLGKLIFNHASTEAKKLGPGPGPNGPWPIGAMGPCPLGPWAQAHRPLPIGPMGPCPLGPGPGPVRAQGPMPIGPGPMGPCPLGPCMGPCPLGPGGAKILIFQKVWEWLPLVWKMSGYLGGVFWSYLGPPSSHIIKKSQKNDEKSQNPFLPYFPVYSVYSRFGVTAGVMDVEPARGSSLSLQC